MTQNAHLLQISNAAIQQLATILEKHPGGFLRITVHPGGCNGFEYQLMVDTNTYPDDVTLTPSASVMVVVDEMSLSLIEGAELDYETDLIGSAFRIKNPKAASSCGCGNSFSM